MFIVDDKRLALFDGRMHNFPYVTAMPHLNWSTFNGGILQFARKSKMEKMQATDSFGGFRSSAFISALFQIYHAIGFNDDVLPNEYNYVNETKQQNLHLFNIRRKIHMALETLLDVYFDCKRTEWDPTTLDDFEKKLISVGVHVSLVWELKQALVTHNQSSFTPNKMRNLHKLLHLGIYIKRYGSLIHLDTGTFESYHKVATTGIYNGTSKRYNGLFEEMIKGIMKCDYNRLMDNIEKIVTEGTKFADIKNPSINVVGVTFQRILNTSKFQFIMLYDNSDFVIDDDDDPQYWSKVGKQQCMDSPNKFRDFIFGHQIGKVIMQAYPTIQWNRRFIINYDTYIIQAISYKSDQESQMGTGTIYATSKYNKNDSSDDYVDKPRYDYVYIKYDNDIVLVRILLILMIEKRIPSEDVEVEDEMIMLLVQLMYKMNTHVDIKTNLGDVYQWARDARNDRAYEYDIVPVQSIIRPAFVIPVLREGYNGISPSYLDRFIVLDRKFFDRSGWDTVNQTYTHFDNVAEQAQYINEHQTEAKRLMKSNSVQEDNNSDQDDCEYESNESDNEQIDF